MLNSKQKLRISLKSYDIACLDRAAKEVKKTAQKVGSIVRGPIPMPVRTERFTVNTSPTVDKKAREQFQIRTSKRLIIINDPDPQIVEALDKLSIPGGVSIEMKLIEN
jgi:small subunit ribosomal protein S10